eukprot:scaffold167987_cov24-Tisochrysis_lutea.AAC.1
MKQSNSTAAAAAGWPLFCCELSHRLVSTLTSQITPMDRQPHPPTLTHTHTHKLLKPPPALDHGLLQAAAHSIQHAQPQSHTSV